MLDGNPVNGSKLASFTCRDHTTISMVLLFARERWLEANIAGDTWV